MKTTVFKTIQLGGTKPKLKGINVSSWAGDMLEKVSYQKKKEACDLVLLTPAELGFKDPPATIELYAAAKEQGYDLCPAEVGPRLREAYTDQPMGEWLYIAMNPIPDSGGDPDVFNVGRDGDGGLWLGRGWAGPADRWGLVVRLLFRLRNSSQDSETEGKSLRALELISEIEDRLAALKALV